MNKKYIKGNIFFFIYNKKIKKCEKLLILILASWRSRYLVGLIDETKFEIMETKIKGDIAEQAVILKCLQLGWAILKPIGDRLPYDLVIDTGDNLVKIQVKSAWLNIKTNTYMVDNRKTITNTRNRKVKVYDDNDFHYAIIYIDVINVFYILPSNVFNSYGSGICLVEEKRQRKAKSFPYRENWNLIK